jgi:hypothetical protein
MLQEDSVQNLRQWSSSPLHPSGQRGISSGRSSVKQHLSGRQEISVRTPVCVQKLQTVPGCIRSDVSVTRPHAFQYLTSKMISFLNTDMGRQLQPFGRRGYSVWMLSLIRQDVKKIYNCLDISLHSPDAQPLLWKARATKVQPSGC